MVKVDIIVGRPRKLVELKICDGTLGEVKLYLSQTCRVMVEGHLIDEEMIKVERTLPLEKLEMGVEEFTTYIQGVWREMMNELETERNKALEKWVAFSKLLEDVEDYFIVRESAQIICAP